MEVTGSNLVGLNNEDFLCIGLRVPIIGQTAVSQGKQDQSSLGKTSGAKVRDIPPKHIVPDFVVFWTLVLPLPGTPIGKGGVTSSSFGPRTRRLPAGYY